MYFVGGQFTVSLISLGQNPIFIKREFNVYPIQSMPCFYVKREIVSLISIGEWSIFLCSSLGKDLVILIFGYESTPRYVVGRAFTSLGESSMFLCTSLGANFFVLFQ